jgi:hypothetical protein
MVGKTIIMSVSKHISKAAVCLMAVAAAFSFLQKRSVQPDVVKRVILYKSFPFMNANNELSYLEDTLSLFYWQNITMCQIPYTFLNVKNFKVVSTENRHVYLIYRQGNTQGHVYNSVNEDITNGEKRGVDSIVKKYVFSNDVSAVKDSLRFVNSTKKGATSIETYVPDMAYNNPMMFDSIYLYYNKNLADIPFSFSRKIDSVYKTKIYRYDVIFNPKYSPEDNYTFPKRQASYKFEVSEAFNDQKTADFMKAYSIWYMQ